MDSNLAYSSGALYYRHSGKVSPPGLVKAVLLGTLVAVPLGAIYAYADLYNPIAGWITFLLTGGAGLLLGKVIATLIRTGKIRNLPVAMLLAAFLAGLMLVTSWEIWIYALLQRAGQAVGLLEFLTHPQATLDVVVFLYNNGAWTISGTTPTGVLLALIWLAEAGLLVGTPLTLARKAAREVPFCEKCDKWCKVREILNFVPGDKDALRAKLEGKDFAALTALGKAPPSAMHFWHATFQGCPDCDTTQTLCITDLALSYDNKGKLQTKRKPVITQLNLSPEDTVAVAMAAAALTAPPPEPAAPASTTAVAPADGTSDPPPAAPTPRTIAAQGLEETGQLPGATS